MRTKMVRKLMAAVMSTLLLTVMTMPLTTHAAAADVSINWNDVKQEIDGFGVSQAGWSGAIYDLQEPARSEIMDLLFTQDQGIGLSILRGALFAEFNPAPGQFDFTVRPDQVWVMQQAKARGVDKLVASTWSPPAWMKTNNSTTHGGYLKQENYGDYALLMSKFIKEYKQQFDLDLYAVSIANEPNSMTFLTWDSSEWNSTNFQVFLKDYLKQAMINEGVSQTKVIAGESSWWSEDLIKDSLNDPASAERLDIVGGHNYPIPILNLELPTTPFSTAVSKGKKVWMTEVSKVDSYDPSINSGLKFAKQTHDFMTKAGVNAWMYWTGAIPGDNDEGLINVDKDTSTYKMTKRYYTLGNFSKFIKQGYVRIGATENPKSNVYFSAYKDPATDRFTIVALNTGDVTAEVNLIPNGFTAGTLTPYTTDDQLNLAQGPAVAASNGKFQTIIPAHSVVTFVGQKGSPPAPQEQTLVDELDDWSKTSSHTSGLVMDSSNSGYFNGDKSRVKRLNGTTESFVYNLPNISSFRADMYQFSVWDGIAFYVSSDQVNWTKLAHASTPGVYTGSQWYQKTYYSTELPPPGTQYLKIELSGSDSWEKQVSRMTIKYAM
ncbi:hypothetical protein M3201_05465 [Paenibacillus motobuensis]|uniref:glycoside hydrolase family 30 protein n=1 Tax=Paenibacillus TaxID=44249 RepID=UPI00204180DB|nr:MULTISPECIES: glycoside hydrolase [Paenibacillus]MCM3039144.1 hypothetical protein [Paenibacillus lutimineralis]MCM3646248.1 hypothetical protein [Paenibacillus motobuensis]